MNATVTFFAGEERLSGARVTVDGVPHQLDEQGAAVVALPVGERVFAAVIGDRAVERTIGRHGATPRFFVDLTADDRNHPFPDLVGLVGDRFAIRSIVARAATGTVVQAWDRQEEREVALRSPSDELSAREEANQVFLVEARNLVALEHPNLLNIYEVLAVKGRGILVTEWATGVTLDRLMREGELSREDAWEIILPLASGVSQLHREEIIHRDLHGANVIVRQNAGPKLIDLGLARSLADVYLGAARVHATREHCAPEQFQGLHVTPATDVYQLTMLFYRIWAGGWPFESKDIESAHVSEPPAPLPEAPEALRALVERGLSKQARRRFVDAGEWFQAFSSLREQMQVEAELERQREEKWPVGLVAAVVALVVIFSGAAAFYLVAGAGTESTTEAAEVVLEDEKPAVLEGTSGEGDVVPTPTSVSEVSEREFEARTAVEEAIGEAAEADLEQILAIEAAGDVAGGSEGADDEDVERSSGVKRGANVTNSSVKEEKVETPRKRSLEEGEREDEEGTEGRESTVEVELAPASDRGGERLLKVEDDDNDSIFLPVD